MSTALLYKAVPITLFRSVTRDITFDLFLRLSEHNYAHVFSRTTGLDYKRLADYSRKGVEELYIKLTDDAVYQTFINRTTDQIFADPTTSQEKKIATLLNMTEQNMAEVFSQFDVPEETAEASCKVIKNYVELMTQDPQSLALILRLVSHGEYLYYHSIAVGIFSIFIAKATGQFDSKTIEMIGVGGFMHDIGNAHLPKELLEKAGMLTPEEETLKNSHARVGLLMIEKTPNISDEVRWIVYQHHEQPDGKGYPNQLASKAMYYPAKIVGVVDEFSSLISQRPGKPALSVQKAIDLLRASPGKYDADLVKLLASIFLRQTKVAA